MGMCIATAVLAVAGVAVAGTEIGSGLDSGLEAAGGASGSYGADASGAYDVTTRATQDLRSRAEVTWEQAERIDAEYRAGIRDRINTTEEPQVEPGPDVDFEAIDRVEVAHEDRLEKGIETHNGVVDAQADAGAWGSVRGFFSGIGRFLSSIVDDVRGGASVDADVKAQANEGLDAVDELDADVRATLDDALTTELKLPPVEPQISGSYGLESATEVTGGAQSLVGLGLP